MLPVLMRRGALDSTLQTLAQLGEAGANTFLMYLLIDRGTTLLTVMMVVGAIGGIAFIIARTLTSNQQLVTLYNMTCGTTSHYLNEREFRDLQNWILEHGK